MPYGKRHFEYAGTVGAQDVPVGPLTWYAVLPTATATRSRAVIPQIFICQIAAGNETSVDGWVAADTTTASRLGMGFSFAITDSRGTLRLPNKQVGLTETGGVFVIPLPNRLFRGFADAALTGIPGSFGFTDGTITDGSSVSTFTPDPMSNDLIKNSTYSATMTTNAFKVINYDPDLDNLATRRTVLFTVGSTYITSTPLG